MPSNLMVYARISHARVKKASLGSPPSSPGQTLRQLDTLMPHTLCGVQLADGE